MFIEGERLLPALLWHAAQRHPFRISASAAPFGTCFPAGDCLVPKVTVRRPWWQLHQQRPHPATA